MHEVTVPEFTPSVNGFHFANAWPAGPTVRFGPFDPRVVGIGDASTGLCGGMVYTVADLYAFHLTVPPNTVPPVNGSAQFRSIVRRQIESLYWLSVPARFWTRMALGGSFGGDRARTTHEREWPKAKAALDRGELVPLGLIRVAAADPRRLTHNHQVVAWGYVEDGASVGVRIYDPNWPDRDDVSAIIHLDNALRPTSLSQTTCEPLLAFFVLPYRASEPRAWR